MCLAAIWPPCAHRRGPRYRALWRSASTQWKREVNPLSLPGSQHRSRWQSAHWCFVCVQVLTLTVSTEWVGTWLSSRSYASRPITVMFATGLCCRIDHDSDSNVFMSWCLAVGDSAPCCLLTACAPVVWNRGAGPGGWSVGGRSCHHRSSQVVLPRASGAAFPIQPVQQVHFRHQ